MNPSIRCVELCPHCCNRAPQELLFAHSLTERTSFIDPQGSEIHDEMPAAYFVSACETCRHLLIYYSGIEVPEPEDFTKASLIWPAHGIVSLAIPDRVQRSYAQALRVKNSSADSFAVQIRRSLEVVCDDFQIPKGSLAERLSHLSRREEFPAHLTETTDILRILGNEGAHGGQALGIIGSAVLDQFFQTILDYLYVSPHRVKMVREALQAIRQSEPGGSR